MPVSFSAYRIFISATGEVAEDLDFIKSQFEKWNTFNQDKKIIFQPLTWIDNVGAEFGQSAQDIIDESVGEFDGYIGLLWTRIGTPTNQEQSGVIHEFKNAIKRQEQGGCNLVSLFFKITPRPINQIDPSQFLAVSKFKDEIKSDGLYREYDTADDLERQLNLYISRFIEKLGQKDRNQSIKSKQGVTSIEQSDENYDEELGLIEIDQFISDKLTKMTEYANSMQVELEECGKVASTASQNLETMKKLNILNKESAIEITKKVAKTMISNSNKIDKLNLNYQDSFRAISNKLPAYIDILSDFTQESPNNELVSATIKLVSSIEYSLTNLNELIISIDNLPRITKDITIARKKLSISLSNSKLLLDDLGKSFSAFIASQF